MERQIDDFRYAVICKESVDNGETWFYERATQKSFLLVEEATTYMKEEIHPDRQPKAVMERDVDRICKEETERLQANP